MDIELHGECTGRQRSLERHERVLGSTSRISAVSDDLDVAQMAYSSEAGRWLVGGKCRMDGVGHGGARL